MNKAEFQKAYKIAVSDRDLTEYDDSILVGFGLKDFQPICVTVETAARTIRWQCVCLNGLIDQEALTECRNGFRRKVTIVTTEPN